LGVRRALKILRLPVSVLDIQSGLLPLASRVDPALFVIVHACARVTDLKKACLWALK
jgi:hypothetical protein